MQLGNMQVSKNVDGVNEVTCHCGKQFMVSGLEFTKDGTIVKHQLIGNLNFVSVEGIRITCPFCDCPWSLGKWEDEIPESLQQKGDIKLRYFVSYATIDKKEVEFALGMACDLSHFLALTMGSISKYKLSSLRVSEITQEEAIRINSKANKDIRNSLVELLETFFPR